MGSKYFFFKGQLAGVTHGLSNSGHPSYFLKKLNITLTGSITGQQKKYIKAPGSLG